MADEPEFRICGAPSSIGNTSVCVREHGHDGEHWVYGEGRAGPRTYGITVLNESDGERLWHFTMEGKPGDLTPLEVGAMAAYFEMAGQMLRDRKAEDAG